MHIFFLWMQREIGLDPLGKNSFPSNGMEIATRYISVDFVYIYKFKNSRYNLIPGHFQPGMRNDVLLEKEEKTTGLVARKKGHTPATFQNKGSHLRLSLDCIPESG